MNSRNNSPDWANDFLKNCGIAPFIFAYERCIYPSAWQEEDRGNSLIIIY